MSRKVIVNLPADLEKHVEGVDGRRLPSMIVEALRAHWLEEPFAKMADSGAVPTSLLKKISAEIPVWGSIPAERKQ